MCLENTTETGTEICSGISASLNALDRRAQLPEPCYRTEQLPANQPSNEHQQDNQERCDCGLGLSLLLKPSAESRSEKDLKYTRRCQHGHEDSGIRL
jgi:hypothetical protein